MAINRKGIAVNKAKKATFKLPSSSGRAGTGSQSQQLASSQGKFKGVNVKQASNFTGKAIKTARPKAGVTKLALARAAKVSGPSGLPGGKSY